MLDCNPCQLINTQIAYLNPVNNHLHGPYSLNQPKKN